MIASFGAFRRPAARLVWLLVALLPMQATAVAWLGAAGPSHAHRTAPRPVETRELIDFRRLGAEDGAAEARAHAEPWAHASGARHHHADLAVDAVPVDDGWSGIEGSGDDRGIASGAPAFLPLPSTVASWTGGEVRETYGAATRWWPIAADRQRLERPPR